MIKNELFKILQLLISGQPTNTRNTVDPDSFFSRKFPKIVEFPRFWPNFENRNFPGNSNAKTEKKSRSFTMLRVLVGSNLLGRKKFENCFFEKKSSLLEIENSSNLKKIRDQTPF